MGHLTMDIACGTSGMNSTREILGSLVLGFLMRITRPSFSDSKSNVENETNVRGSGSMRRASNAALADPDVAALQSGALRMQLWHAAGGVRPHSRFFVPRAANDPAPNPPMHTVTVEHILKLKQRIKSSNDLKEESESESMHVSVPIEQQIEHKRSELFQASVSIRLVELGSERVDLLQPLLQ